VVLPRLSRQPLGDGIARGVSVVEIVGADFFVGGVENLRFDALDRQLVLLGLPVVIS